MTVSRWWYHFVRGNDEAGVGLAGFTALGGVETHENNVKSRGHHVQSFPH